MDKWQLIEITLEQLLQQWKHNKDLFVTDTKESREATLSRKPHDKFISWEPPAEPDPEQKQLALVSKTVRITYSPSGKYFKCEIYGRSKLPSQPGTHIIAQKRFIPIRSLYWDFVRLRKAIIEHRRTRENNNYLKNLYNVFPGTLDDYLLGGNDDED